ncbi:MAG: DUF2252 domain-containing protein [Atopobiaceae bacterium]
MAEDPAEASTGRNTLAGAAAHTISSLLSAAFAEQERRTPDESRIYGAKLREEVPAEAQAMWPPKTGRPDPLELLESQAKDRVSELLPIRYERMAENPFAFYRGCALPMAGDLATTPTTPLRVQASGDAHIANFGIFSTPERQRVFDLNDFDETARGPWEWDLKRLAASVEVCARVLGISKEKTEKAVHACVNGYHQSMRQFAEMGNLEVWYAQANADQLAALAGEVGGKSERKAFEKTLSKAERKNNARAIQKFTEVVDGKLRIVSDPPLIVPVRDVAQKKIQESSFGEHLMHELAQDAKFAHEDATARLIRLILQGYRASPPENRRALLDSYHGVDIARKVVGVGSVGLRAWICVFEGADADDPLVLQIKEAVPSVLERYVGKSGYAEQGQRVVEGQRAIQVSSDLLLGWTRLPGEDGRLHDYYVRQLWDGKGAPDLTKIDAHRLTHLSALCGWTLARAHARTGDRFAIASYFGDDTAMDEAFCTFAHAYADQTEEDFEAFLAARKQGRFC